MKSLGTGSFSRRDKHISSILSLCEFSIIYFKKTDEKYTALMAFK